jgi:hypothetical protein
MFRLNTEGQLTSGEWCTNVDSSGGITVQWCTMGTTDGPWEYRPEQKQMYHKTLGTCMALEPESSKPIMRPCDNNNSYHKWTWKEIKPYWAKNAVAAA